jgi:2-polyprenyl-3-methyl-5-hydroxy-6-metoxy-1,4-benzoquinol methylase
MIERESVGAISMSTEAAQLVFEPAPMFRKTALQDDSETAIAGGKRIAILIVTYNAASTLLAVLKRITPNVWRNVEEVVVFDDASQDVTYEAVVGLKTLLHLPKLRVIKHEKNLGYGGNQKAGYRYLIERGFDIVVLLHGDGQYAPEILSHLYAPLVRGDADAVFGSRMMRTYGGPLQGGMPLYKYVGNRILTRLENWVLGMKLTEFHSGYRAYSLASLKRIEMRNMTNDFHFDTEIIVKLKHQGFRIKEVPIPTYYGGEICHVNGMRYAGDVVRAVWRYRRTVASVRSFPEFEEYWARYPLKVARYSSHGYVMRIVRGAIDVLDIGCGHGYLSARLSEGGCRVTGVDVLPEPERLTAMEAYVECDLARGMDDALGRLRVHGYDRVLLLDVLEHLPEAEQILRHAGDLLKEEGLIVVSLPNVANIAVRMMLLLGRWDYTDRGILDKSHLRFYTRKTGRKLLEQNGFEVVKRWMTNIPVELVLGMKPETRIMRGASACLHAATLLMPGLLGYQMMFVARKGSTEVVSDFETPARID